MLSFQFLYFTLLYFEIWSTEKTYAFLQQTIWGIELSSSLHSHVADIFKFYTTHLKYQFPWYPTKKYQKSESERERSKNCYVVIKNYMKLIVVLTNHNDAFTLVYEQQLSIDKSVFYWLTAATPHNTQHRWIIYLLLFCCIFFVISWMN